MKKRTGFLALVLALIMLLLLTACQSTAVPQPSQDDNQPPNPDEKTTETPTNKPAPDHATLKMLLWGDLKKTDEVITVFEEMTLDELNISLDLQFIPLADFKEKLPLIMATGEDLDITFDAEWISLKTNAADGLYHELDAYFADESNAGLQMFGKDLLENNKYYDHIYAIPHIQSYWDSDVFFYRGDLREKYGMSEFTTDEDFFAFLNKVSESEDGMMPISLDARRGWRYMGARDMNTARDQNIASVSTEAASFRVLLNEDASAVESMVLVLGNGSGGEPAEAYANWPAGWGYEEDLEWATKMVDYAKYAETDVMLQEDRAGVYVAGKAAATEGSLTNFTAWDEKLKSSVPGAYTEFYATTQAVRNHEPEAIGTAYKAWNFTVFPYQSKKLDRSMAFMNWLFETQDNHDLFEHGVEGTHWEKVGDDQYRLPEGVDANDNYLINAYELTWIPQYVRTLEGTDEKILEHQAYEREEGSYYKTVLAGFNFDPTPVSTEIAKIGALDDEIINGILCGQYDDPQTVLEEYYAKCTKQGLETLRQEVIKQVNEFLAAKQ